MCDDIRENYSLANADVSDIPPLEQVGTEMTMSTETVDTVSSETTVRITFKRFFSEQNGVKAIFILLGILSLLPWNLFLNSVFFFVDYKMNCSNDCTNSLLFMRNNFVTFIILASVFPMLISSVVNLTCNISFSPRTLVPSLIISSIMYGIIMSLIFIDDSLKLIFFISLLISVSFLNFANAMFDTSLYSMAAIFPPPYVLFITIGKMMSGVVTSLLVIILIAVEVTVKIKVCIYFIFAIIGCLLSIVFVMKITRSNLYKEFLNTFKESGLEIDKIMVLKHIYPLCFIVTQIFTVTIVIFPNLGLKVKTKDTVLGAYFYPLLLFLFFNISASIGSVAGLRTKSFSIGRNYHVFVFLRNIVSIAVFVFMLNVLYDICLYIAGILFVAFTNSIILCHCISDLKNRIWPEFLTAGMKYISISINIGILSASLINIVISFI